MRCPEQKGSDIIAEVTQVVTERATRLVAFDRDGGLYQSEEEQGGESAGLVRCIHRFKGLDINNIDHLEFQIRPYDYWVIFHNVSLDSGYKTNVEIEIKKPGSLLGEILPGFDSIDVDKQREQLKGKALCICFFDMNQRPSRHLVQQLAKKAEKLGDRDIAVVLVQVTEIEHKTLDEWLTKYKIPFDCGIFKGDFEKKKLQWGAKSLPWLILTDSKHIVRAEGFGITELDTKMQEITSKR